MKKILIFIAMVMVLLSSCTTRDIEQEANEQLAATMREMAKRPDDAKLLNVRTVYKCDSLCILQFQFHGKSVIGLESSTPMEYIYLYDNSDGNKTKYECWTDLDPVLSVSLTMDDDEREIAKELAEEGYDYEYLMQHTVADIKEKYREKLLKDAPYTKKAPNLEDRLMYSAAWLRLDANSREVPKEKGKDIKL